jgi:hypothetical protein
LRYFFAAGGRTSDIDPTGSADSSRSPRPPYEDKALIEAQQKLIDLDLPRVACCRPPSTPARPSSAGWPQAAEQPGARAQPAVALS